MATFTLCILLALATMTLARPNNQATSEGAKILAVIQGKEVIKAFLHVHPEIDYQVVGSHRTEDFPNSKTGAPGQLRVMAVIRGQDAIGNYIDASGMPYTVPDGMQPSEMPFEQPPASLTPQELVNSGLGNLPEPSPFVGDPPRPLTHEEELAAWNSGLGKEPNLGPAAGPAVAPSYARAPPGQSDEATYKEQLDAWNNGLRNYPPDAPNPALQTTAANSYARSPLGGHSEGASLTDTNATHKPDAKNKREDSNPNTPTKLT